MSAVHQGTRLNSREPTGAPLGAEGGERRPNKIQAGQAENRSRKISKLGISFAGPGYFLLFTEKGPEKRTKGPGLVTIFFRPEFLNKYTLPLANGRGACAANRSPATTTTPCRGARLPEASEGPEGRAARALYS